MFVQAFTVLLPFVLQAAASPYHRQSIFKTDDCPSGIHIIGVRGTLEPPPYGALQSVVNQLKDEIPGSDDVGIDYPASGISVRPDGSLNYNIVEYSGSVLEGYDKLSFEIEDFAQRCPDTGIVVMGYSQGAHVVGNALCGATNPLLPKRPPIERIAGDSIRAIIQLGDPTNVRNLPWHVGNSTKWGWFPRADFSACREYGDFWQSYCDADDLFCDSGNSLPVHESYVRLYKDRIVDFIVGNVEGSRSSGLKHNVKCNDL